MCYAIIAGRWFTVDCLTEEKREGTLGLLFLTDLKSHDIVLGKLAATSLNGFFSLLALFPVMAVPMLMGGTAYGEFWRVSILLVATFLLSLAIGIAASANEPDLPRAAAKNMVKLLLSMIVPLIAFGSASGTGSAFFFWFFFLCTAALINGNIREAMRAAARAWRESPEAPAPTVALPAAGQFLPAERLRERAAYRKKTLDINAYCWLAIRDPRKRAHVWFFLIFGFAWWFLGWLLYNDYWFIPPIVLLTSFLANTTLKLWLVLESSHQLAEDRRSGAIELLLSSPLGFRDILRGQWLVRRSLFLGPMVLVGVVELLLMLPHAASITSDSIHVRLVFLIIAGVILLAADYFTLGIVATHQAVISRSPAFASSMTVFKILLLPLLVVGATATFLGVRASMLNIDGPGFAFFFALWFGLRLIFDAAFAASAWRQLQNNFQTLAVKRFSPRGR